MIQTKTIKIEKGEVETTNPVFTMDMKVALVSVQKIKRLKTEKIICYHGGIKEGSIEAKVDNLLSRYQDQWLDR